MGATMWNPRRSAAGPCASSATHIPSLVLMLLASFCPGATSDASVDAPFSAAPLEARSELSFNELSCYSQDGEDVESCRSERLTFLHIPKNAGTTIETLGHASGVNWGKNMDWHSCHLGHGQCYAKWHEPPALLSERSPYVDTTVFCVVRNPVDRVVSEYRYIYENPEFQWDNADIFSEFGCSSVGLNAWVNRILNSFLDGQTYIQLCHMIPQAYYIWGPPDDQGNQCQYCHEILRLENLTDSFNELMQRYDEPVQMEPHHHDNAGGCQNLNRDSLNDASRRLIARVYERDFALLNYTM